jgi:DNA adenine methylase
VSVSATTEPPTRPLLRYHGGKWRMAPWLLDLFPAHHTYVEPFGGGASVLLQKPRAKAEIYNDLDREIVNVFAQMRDNGAALIDKLRFTPFARDEFELSREPAVDALEQARRTIVRSFMGYGTTLTRINVGNGEVQRTGFRRLRRDSTTTAADWSGLPDAFLAIFERLQGVIIENRDACEVMIEHDSPATLHYVDPPYVHSTRQAKMGQAKMGYRHEMDDDGHRRLADTLCRLKGMVIVSGYPSALYDDLFDEDVWERRERKAWAINAAERCECIWTRNMPLDRGLFGYFPGGEG